MAEPRQPRKNRVAPSDADESRRPLSPEELRRQAEERLDALSSAAAPTPEELTAAVHELRVHQIELEMQNEELRGAQHALDEQRAKYFDLFDLAPVGYLTIGDKGIVGDANFTAAHLLGVERQQLVGRPFTAFVLAADRDAYYLQHRSLQQTGEQQSCELRLQRLGGEPFWAHLESRRQGAADGEPRRYHLTFTDVDERVVAEEALRESEAKYREVVERATDGIAVLQGGLVVFANEALARMSGYSVGELTGMPFRDGAEEGRREIAERVRRRFAGEDLPANDEIVLLRKDGTPFTVEMSAGIISYEGAPGELVIMRDVTERKRAEEALRQSQEQLDRAVEGSGVGLWEWQVRSGETVFSERWAEIAGYTLAELAPVSIETWRSLCHPDDLERSDELLEQHFSGQTPLYECETRMRHKDGHWIWVLDRGTVSQRDGHGRALRVTGTHLDVTARKRAEEVLLESEQNFRTFFDTVDDIIVVATPDGRLLYANPTASARLGYSADDLTGMQLVDLYPAEKRGEAADVLGELRGSKISCSLPLQSRSGALVPAETRLWSGTWDGADSVFAVSKDLTREQEALQKFERLFHGSPAMMSVNSLPEGRFTDVNTAFLSAHGYSREEIIGHTSAELGLFVEAEQYRVVAQKLLAEGRVRNRELSVRCKDGSVLDGLFSMEMVKSQAEMYVLTVMVDQTERKRAQEKLRASEEQLDRAVEGSGAGLWDWQVQSGEAMFNKRWAEIVGYTLAELAPLSVETWTRLCHPDDLRRSNELLDEHFSGRLRRYKCEARMRHKDGHWVWVLTRGKVSEWDGDGRPLRMSGTHLDISERKAIEEDIARALSLLESTMESTADGILVADGKGAMLRFNARFKEIWGIPEAIAASQDDDAALGFVFDQLTRNPSSFCRRYGICMPPQRRPASTCSS